jgi:hypothetical protein
VVLLVGVVGRRVRQRELVGWEWEGVLMRLVGWCAWGAIWGRLETELQQGALLLVCSSSSGLCPASGSARLREQRLVVLVLEVLALGAQTSAVDP